MKALIQRIKNWEAWPFGILYAPLAPVWAWYMLKSGYVWFFTPSNPKITFGGMEGEPKKEMYDLLPKNLYPKTIYIEPNQEFSVVLNEILSNGFEFPFVVKPNNGEQGILFRKIDNEEQLRKYNEIIPVSFIVQELCLYNTEVSVFYIRHPLEKSGRITGFLKKEPMHVVGDGRKTIGELAANNPKAKKQMDMLKIQHQNNWEMVVAPGTEYKLSYAANHNRGAMFTDLKKHITDEMLAHFDEISHGINDFFYGRYDIMCNSIEDLKNWKNFSILEFNGCGAEPNHFYDTGYTLKQAYNEILMHWKYLFEISQYNTKQGIKPWSFEDGKNYISKTKALMKKLREIDAQLP